MTAVEVLEPASSGHEWYSTLRSFVSEFDAFETASD